QGVPVERVGDVPLGRLRAGLGQAVGRNRRGPQGGGGRQPRGGGVGEAGAGRAGDRERPVVASRGEAGDDDGLAGHVVVVGGDGDGRAGFARRRDARRRVARGRQGDGLHQRAAGAVLVEERRGRAAAQGGRSRPDAGDDQVAG